MANGRREARLTATSLVYATTGWVYVATLWMIQFTVPHVTTRSSCIRQSVVSGENFECSCVRSRDEVLSLKNEDHESRETVQT